MNETFYSGRERFLFNSVVYHYGQRIPTESVLSCMHWRTLVEVGDILTVDTPAQASAPGKPKATKVRGTDPGGTSTAIKATAAAIELADEYDIDLSGLRGSGRDAQITKRDVENIIRMQSE